MNDNELTSMIARIKHEIVRRENAHLKALTELDGLVEFISKRSAMKNWNEDESPCKSIRDMRTSNIHYHD